MKDNVISGARAATANPAGDTASPSPGGRARALLCSTALACLIAVAAPVSAQNTTAGDVRDDGVLLTPGPQSDPLVSSFNLWVGDTGIGTLTIAGGAGGTSVFAVIGRNTGADGTVTVQDAGSTWTNTNQLDVGLNGKGVLNILNGGGVSSNVALIGNAAGSVGEVTVDGANSTWTITNGNPLTVGRLGNGTLTISGGGGVSNGVGSIGSEATGTGAVTVTGANSKWTNTSSLNVGDGGSGTLDIADSGGVSSTAGYIGNAAGSHGMVTVSGANSKWTNSGTLDVGAYGSGMLDILSGGSVSSSDGVIGQNGGSIGTVTVDGLTSRWTNGSYLYVGDYGDGTLIIKNIGGVSNTTGGIAWQSGSHGDVTVEGQDSTWTNNGDLYVGRSGIDTLAIRDGAVVTSVNGYLGTYAGASGAVTVDGAESAWKSSAGIVVGDASGGTGTLTLMNGGMVEAKTGVYVGWVGGSGGGTLAAGAGGGSIVVDSGNGMVNVGPKGILQGQSGAPLSMSNLTLDPGAKVNVALGAPSTNGLFDITNNLTLAGTLNVTDAGGFGAGLYRLFDYGGTLTDKGLGIDAMPAGYAASDFTVQTSVDHQVNLIVAGGSAPPPGGTGPYAFWNGAQTSPSGRVAGGSGTWSAAGTNWTNAAADASGAYDPAALLIFTGTAGTVTVAAGGGALPVGGGLQFARDGFVVQGDGLDLGAGPTTIRVGDGTAGGANYTATIASALGGTGDLDKTDLGRLILSGASTFSGATSVTGGALVVNGSLAKSIVTVRSGARLGGTGTVGGIVANSGGTVAPGNSIGTLNVAGDVTFAAGSVYEVEVNPAGQGDKIAATGKATINGGKVSVLAGSGNYALSTTYTILTAGGGVTGKFTDGVTTNLAFLTPTLGYGADNVTLTLTRNGLDFAAIGGTPNQRAAGAGVDALGQGNAVWNAAVLLDAAGARAAFDRLSGEIHPGVRTGLEDDSRLPREAVLERLSRGDAGRGLWLQAVGDWGSADSDGNASRLTRGAWGMIGGADMGLGAATLGVAGGYTDTRLTNALASRADLKSWHILGYAGGAFGDFVARAGLGYAHADIATRRSVDFTGFSDTLNGATSGSTLQGFGEIGYRVAVRGGMLEPFAGITAVRVHGDGLTERGGAAALTVAGASDSSTSSTLGLKAETTGDGPLFADVSLGWRHRFGDRAPVSAMRFAGGDSFAIAGTPVSKDAAALSLAAGWRAGRGVTLTVRYSGAIGGSSDVSAAKLTLGMRF